MKNILLIFSLLITTIAAFGQINRTELPLNEEENFDINFRFYYDNDSAAHVVNFIREKGVDKIFINNDCRKNNMNHSQLLVDKYSYEQFLKYLQNIDVFTYQPNRNMQDKEAKLRVSFTIMKRSSLSVNAFEMLHNPSIKGDEYQILELMSEVLIDNAIDSCSSAFAERFETYVKGE